MTREEAKGNIIHAIRWNDMPKKEALEFVLDLLEQTEWIPVSERLPEDAGAFLVTTTGKSYSGNDIHRVEIMYLYYTNTSLNDNGLEWGNGQTWEHEWKYTTVKAWMPLPKPYEPQESEEK